MKATANRRPDISQKMEGVVDGFTDEQLAVKMMSMGILPGRTLRLIRKASFGDTYYIQIDNRAMAIRKKEAACIRLK